LPRSISHLLARRVPSLCALLVVLFASVEVLIRLFKFSMLSSLDGISTSMGLGEALCFVLLGTSYLLRPLLSVSRALAILCLFISATALVLYVLEIAFISRLNEFYSALIIPPMTALSVGLLTIALLLLSRGSEAKGTVIQSSSTLSLFVLVLSMAMLIIDLFGEHLSLKLSHYSPITLSTGLSLVLFSFALATHSFVLNKQRAHSAVRPNHSLILFSTLSVAVLWQLMMNAEVENMRIAIIDKGERINLSVKLQYGRTVQALMRMAKRWEASDRFSAPINQADAGDFIAVQDFPLSIEYLDSETKLRWRESSNKAVMQFENDARYAKVRQQSLLKARQQMHFELSQPIMLENDHYALLMVVPLSSPQGELNGYLLSQFALQDYLQSIIKNENTELHTITMRYEGKLIFASEPFTELAPSSLSADFNARDTRYVLTVTAKPRLFDERRSALPDVVMGFGLLLSVLLVFVEQLWKRSKLQSQNLQNNEEKLVKNLALLEAVINELGEPLIIIDRLGGIMRFSSAATQLFEYTEEEILGKDINLLAVHTDSAAEPLFDPHTVQLTSPAMRVLSGITKSNKQFVLEVIISPVAATEGQVLVGLFRDISERRKRQFELLQAKEQAELASAAKSAFLANMSHEIRTPMNSILGTMQILQRNSKDKEQQKLLSNAGLSAKLLLTIINDILDFSKIEANMLTLETTDFQLLPILQGILADFAPQAEANQVPINLYIEPDFQDAWLGDPVRVQQIMLNLIANAVKFTPIGKIDIHAVQHSDKPGLTISVADTGIGMDEATQGTLFERFRQADQSTTRKYGGTGLGMAITAKLVAAMQGSLSLDSKPGKGSTFNVYLPLQSGDKLAKPADDDEQSATPQLSGYTVLVAEDNQINMMIFETLMEPTGVTLLMAENGQQAVELSLQHQPDLIYMDIQMPVMDGIEACRQIKSTQAEIPIIALTANVMDEDIKRYRQEGFTAYLAKPLDMQDLYASLTTYLHG
jgi:PAS domain S-box-containing protein